VTLDGTRPERVADVRGRLEGRVAIVTGASSGIGRAIALRFAAEGAAVVNGDVRADPVEGGTATAELLAADGHDALFVPTDVSSSTEVDRLVDRTLEHFGRVDVLVNNAAAYVGKPLLETTEEEWNRVLAVGVTGVFLLTRRVVGEMLAQPGTADVRGRIVNISSQHGMIAAPKDIAYGTAKSAVVYMTRQIATDYAADGIVCNAVAPGKIVTGKGGRELEPEWQRYWQSRTPWPRLGVPDDVARATVFLASDEASFITGVNLMVDGGWSAS
jgi:NAD(P)-dependent dehydrogenase (short-subunit alcohol dehydrogenase family)